MVDEIQERNIEDISELVSQSMSQPRNQRKFPIPKQVNYYILHNYALNYYNGSPDERIKILNEISANIREYGYMVSIIQIFQHISSHFQCNRFYQMNLSVALRI